MSRYLFLLLLLCLVFLLTSCFNEREEAAGLPFNYQLLEDDLISLQQRMENFFWEFRDLKRSVENNTLALAEMETALEKNRRFTETLYASLTYASVLNTEINLNKLQNIPSLEEIEALIRTEMKKSRNIESPIETDDSERESVSQLQRELSLLRENYRTLKWEMYKNRETGNAGSLPEILSGEFTYVIQSGDTLSQIASSFGLGDTGVEKIMADNRISDPRMIRRGDEIRIQLSPLQDRIRLPIAGRESIIPEDIRAFFGQKTSNGFSRGIVFDTEPGTRIVSCLPGKVIDAGDDYCVIYHGSGLKLIYLKLDNPEVTKGDWVRGGESIGRTSSNEFILETMIHNEYRDPLNLFLKRMGKFEITFYTEWDDGNLPYFPYFRRVKEGDFAREWYSVAADPDYFDKGTLIYIPELKNTPSDGVFVVQDEGSAIKGKKIDVYIRDLTLASKMKTSASVYYLPQK